MRLLGCMMKIRRAMKILFARAPSSQKQHLNRVVSMTLIGPENSSAPGSCCFRSCAQLGICESAALRGLSSMAPVAEALQRSDMQERRSFTSRAHVHRDFSVQLNGS